MSGTQKEPLEGLLYKRLGDAELKVTFVYDLVEIQASRIRGWQISCKHLWEMWEVPGSWLG